MLAALVVVFAALVPGHVSTANVSGGMEAPSSCLTSRSCFRFVAADANFDNLVSHPIPMLLRRLKAGTLFLRCTDEEAEEVRRAAKSERRTVSGYILNAVLSRIEAKEKLLREADNRVESHRS